jgi:hypothetical protein
LEKLRFLESELQQVDERKNRFLIQEEEEEKSEGRKLMDRLVLEIYERKNRFLTRRRRRARAGSSWTGQLVSI